MVALTASGLYRFFHDGDDETAALRGLDLTLVTGEFVALTGPSGSGKSTLLACLAGLDTPDGGHVEVMGERLTRRSETRRARLRARHIGMLMQSGNLVDHLTIAQNIALQRDLAKKDLTSDPESLLEVVGIAHRGGARPAQLSGGEAARAGLCVALAAEPAILICDEPTAEVDAQTEQAILDVLKSRAAQGVAILVATHSRVLAAEANRIIAIRDGRVEQ
ncbi:MAG: ABC transporter ATP-binding protein [Alphaproteobacteria bacterium]|nr:ABC transporter ATP-binding protein [Alphaproteobacteria bacterium]